MKFFEEFHICFWILIDSKTLLFTKLLKSLQILKKLSRIYWDLQFFLSIFVSEIFFCGFWNISKISRNPIYIHICRTVKNQILEDRMFRSFFVVQKSAYNRFTVPNVISTRIMISVIYTNITFACECADMFVVDTDLHIKHRRNVI